MIRFILAQGRNPLSLASVIDLYAAVMLELRTMPRSPIIQLLSKGLTMGDAQNDKDIRHRGVCAFAR